MTPIFFNLLTNSTFSLWMGLIVVGFFLWLFRVETGPWKAFLLSLPFIKIVFDLIRGLPADSILLAKLDPFTLPAKHQILTVGAGFSTWGPYFNVVFSTKDLNGINNQTTTRPYR